MNKINTLQKGSVRTIVFKEKNIWYGVALEFNIVTDGDTPEVVLYNLNQAIKGYVESAKKAKIRTIGILNQKPDAEYEELWERLQNNKKIPSPYQIHSYGRQVTH